VGSDDDVASAYSACEGEGNDIQADTTDNLNTARCDDAQSEYGAHDSGSRQQMAIYYRMWQRLDLY
ncbi:hypothetical protein F444_02839, partial [Phytophthora nicotianae P1976]